jgi:hypothetical protein
LEVHDDDDDVVVVKVIRIYLVGKDWKETAQLKLVNSECKVIRITASSRKYEEVEMRVSGNA